MCPDNLVHSQDSAEPREIRLESDAARLAELNVPFAHAIAAEVMKKLPHVLERKEIQGWAELGLVEAAQSFDPLRGIQFKTFAYYRIRGAIFDGLRKMGWPSKAHYQRLRFEMSANEYLEDVVSLRPPAASGEQQLEDLQNLTANVMSCYMLSLTAMPQEPIDPNQVSAEDKVLRDQQKKNLRVCLSQLPERNRKILELFYFHDRTLEEIGKSLGLSKSWVCRLHAKSLELLRTQLSQLQQTG